MTSAPFPTPQQFDPRGERVTGGPGAGLGIAALILGILGFFPLFGLAAVILGIVALVRSVPDPAHRPGKGAAITGIILGALFGVIGCGGGLVAMLLPAMGKARQAARQVVTASNMQHIGMGLHMYAADNKDWMPETAEGWVGRISPQYIASDKFTSPHVEAGSQQAAFIYVAAGVPLTQIAFPDRFVLAYENPELEAVRRNGGVILYADGSVDIVDQPEFQSIVDAVKGGKNPPR